MFLSRRQSEVQEGACISVWNDVLPDRPVPEKTVPVERKKGVKDVPVYALPKHVPEIAACGYGGATEVNVFVPFVGTWGH